MLILNGQQIQQVITLKEMADAMVEAFRIMEDPKVVVPPRMHIDAGENTFLLMPCHLPEYSGTKLISLFPANPLKGHPAIYGTFILNDGETGKPVAILDGNLLTAVRTGAVSAVGIRYTTGFEISSAGLVGTGQQGFYQMLFACMERPVRDVWLFDSDKNRSDLFIKRISPRLPCVRFNIVDNTEEVVEKAQLIVTATNAEIPVLPDKQELYNNKHIIAIGSYKHNMRELPDRLFTRVDQLFIDTPQAKTESGDVIEPIRRHLLYEEAVIPLSKLITGKVSLTTGKSTIFKSVGMALFDLIAAKLIYEKAIGKNLGTEVEF